MKRKFEREVRKNKASQKNMQYVRRLRKNQLERDSEEYEEDKEEEDSRKVTYGSK